MTQQKLSAVFFDWDDTIVDNFNVAYNALNAALVHMGAAPWSVEETRRRSGPSAKDLFTGLFGADRWEEADRVYYESFLAGVAENISIFDGAVDILKTLRGHNVTMGVVSNKRSALLQHEVAVSGLADYFSVILGAGDAAADKPDPAPILLALEKTGIAPAPTVWYIGDSHTDMMSADRAGCTPVLLETKPPPDDLMAAHPPRLRFRDHAMVMEYLKGCFATCA